jgi:hypothetical protein
MLQFYDVDSELAFRGLVAEKKEEERSPRQGSWSGSS